MRKNKALKLATGILSTALFLSVPSVIAHADSFVSAEQGVAGISAILEKTTDQELEKAYNASIQSLSTEKEETVSPYENLGVSIADDYVNIRKDASTDSEVVGKLYRGCAADILEKLEAGWVKIKSGEVEGYIASDFLAIGDEAESMIDQYATKYATVNTQTLRVRARPDTDSDILTLIPVGETYVITNENKGWVKILLGNDEDTGDEYTGFLNKEFITISVEFKYAVSIEEENRILKEQQEAIQAEKERKEKLAQEEAERNEAARQAQEAAKAEDRDDSNSSSGSSNTGSNSSSNTSSNSSSNTSSNSSSNSSVRDEIVSYALKFVGNPYVWGGESLTNGADCSGFVQAIYADFGYRIPRTSADQASNAGKKVSESEMLPGDLIFYAYSNGRVHHVAMYIGNGKIVHAANSRQGIITSQYNYNDIYCIRRIIN
ncbi:MAG: NlpC/P60 family protein [Herbinix sp.]|nr:NlpC/P60 family protein [Herbinix sp.]